MTWPRFMADMKANTGLTLAILLGGAAAVGALGAKLDQGLSMVQAAATKSEVRELASAVRGQAAVGDSTLRWIIRHDEWSKGRSREVDQQLEDIKTRVRDIELRAYKSGYDEGAADEAVFGGTRPAAAAVRPGPSNDIWFHVEPGKQGPNP